MWRAELMNRKRIYNLSTLVIALFTMDILCAYGAQSGKSSARQILKTPGIRKGVCILIEFDDGQLAEALLDGGVQYIHAISSDQQKVDQAREYIQKKGTYGRIAFAFSKARSIPFVNDIANIVVVSDFGKLKSRGVSISEVVRILAPYGKLFIKGHSGSVPGTDKNASGQWTVFTKRLPEGMDEWTHFEHDPQRTSVSHDMVVDPPAGIRWVSGLFFPFHTGNSYASVNGRNYYWYWAHNTARYGTVKEESKIVCRDAFNGTSLWEKRAPKKVWAAGFAVVGDKVFAHMGGAGGLTALNAATGEELFRFKESKDHLHSEILVSNGVLVQCADGVRAFAADSGRKLWEKPNGLMATDLILTTGKLVYYLFADAPGKPLFLVCCDLKSGKERWRKEQRMEFSKSKFTKALALVSVYRNKIFVASTSRFEFAVDKGAIYAVSGNDGSLLWTYEFETVGHKANPTDVFPIGDELWVKIKDRKKPRTEKQKYPNYYASLDLETGRENGKKLHVGLNRCYPDRALTRYLLTGDFEFVKIPTGETHALPAARMFCDSGLMVANGLTYAFPNRCHCFSLVRGFLGLDKGVVPPEGLSPKAVKGPAYGKTANPKSQISNRDDWPMLRHDAERSNCTKASVSPDVKPAWKAELKTVVSSPVVAAGSVYVACIDEHRVAALDLKTGKEEWSYTTGGRVDSPPLIYQGLAIFGSADGWVYAVRAADGALAWKLQAGPLDCRIMVHGQAESKWPVHGSLMLTDDTLFVAAGRHTHTDGGITYFAADPLTGQIKWLKQAGPKSYDSLHAVMVRGAKSIRIGHKIQFDPKDGKRFGGHGAWYDKVVAAPWGFLPDLLSDGPTNATVDSSRRQWSYSRFQQSLDVDSGRGKRGIRAVVMAVDVDNDTVYGVTEKYRHERRENTWITIRDLRMYCNQPDGKDSWKDAWSVDVESHNKMRALVCTADALILAVQPKGEGPGELWFVSKTDGSIMKTVKLDSVPRWDGIGVSQGNMIVTTEDGKVLCFGSR